MPRGSRQNQSERGGTLVEVALLFSAITAIAVLSLGGTGSLGEKTAVSYCKTYVRWEIAELPPGSYAPEFACMSGASGGQSPGGFGG